MRSLDVQVARRMYHVESLNPAWYRNGMEVLCFYLPGQSLIGYSYDEHACNAMMFCNGIDETQGTASPLPHFSSAMEDLNEVLQWVRKQGGTVSTTIRSWEVTATVTTATGLTETVTTPLTYEYTYAEEFAAAVCSAFVTLYPERP